MWYKEYYNKNATVNTTTTSINDLRFCFEGNKSILIGYSNSNIVGDINSINSNWIKFEGDCGLAIKTTELCNIVYYKGKVHCLTYTYNKFLWLKKLLQEYDFVHNNCPLFVESQNVIHLCKNQTFHSRTKHINVRYHYR